MESIVLGMAQIPVDDTFGPLPAVVMVVVLVGFAIFMTFSIRGKIARRNAVRPSARELVEQMRNHPRVVAGDAQGFAADLYDTARRLSAQLDNKARRLEKLIDDADKRIAALGARPAATPRPGLLEYAVLGEVRRLVAGPVGLILLFQVVAPLIAAHFRRARGHEDGQGGAQKGGQSGVQDMGHDTKSSLWIARLTAKRLDRDLHVGQCL